MKIGIATVQVPFVHGGAEVHSHSLARELRARGFEADIITIPFKWYPPQRILDSIAISRMLDLEESNGQRIDRLIGLKFPAYMASHSNKVLWILHQHRTAYELWDHPYFGDMISFPDGKAVRDAIRYADNKFIPEAKAVYANSRNVAQRLKAANGLLARPLYHPPENADAFYGHEAEDFMFFPSRITRLKRQDLVISALAHCHEKVRIVFAGAFEDPDYKSELQRLADRLGVGHQVIWKGFVSDEEKRDLYARCTATVYPPLDEDYGYITLEAMLSRKAVITAIDSGGPLEFVIDGETGFVVDAEPIALGEVMDKLWSDRSLAARMGQAGAAFYHSNQISWDHVVDVLTA